MIKTKVAYLNKEIVVEEEEPSTIPELVTLIGEDAIVTNTNSNLRYRNKYPRVYKRISIEVEKLGFLCDDDEDEMKHLKRFFTSSSENKAKLVSLFNEIAPQEPLFIRGDRVGGGGRLAQGALDAAHRYLAEGRQDEAVGTIESMLPTYRVPRDVEGNVTAEGLARGIQTLQRHLTSKAKLVVQNL